METRSLLILIVGTVVALFSTTEAAAGDVHLVLNGRSFHLDSSYAWNQNNAGVGVEYHFEQESPWRRVAMANSFRDSNDGMSYMAGAGLHRRLYETDRLAGFYVYAGLNAFLMTREDVNDNRPFPGVLPSLSVGNRHLGFNLTYLPRKAVEDTTNSTIVDPTISGIVFVQFKINVAQLFP